MRIHRETAGRLELQARPTGLTLLGGFVFLSLGATAVSEAALGHWFGAALATLGVIGVAALMLALLERTVVIFDRATDSVTIRRISTRRRTEDRRPLSALRGLEVQESAPETETPETHTTYRAALVFDGETLPLTLVYSSGTGAERIVTEVRRWLALDSGQRRA